MKITYTVWGSPSLDRQTYTAHITIQSAQPVVENILEFLKAELESEFDDADVFISKSSTMPNVLQVMFAKGMTEEDFSKLCSAVQSSLDYLIEHSYFHRQKIVKWYDKEEER